MKPEGESSGRSEVAPSDQVDQPASLSVAGTHDSVVVASVETAPTEDVVKKILQVPDRVGSWVDRTFNFRFTSTLYEAYWDIYPFLFWPFVLLALLGVASDVSDIWYAAHNPCGLLGWIPFFRRLSPLISFIYGEQLCTPLWLVILSNFTWTPVVLLLSIIIRVGNFWPRLGGPMLLASSGILQLLRESIMTSSFTSMVRSATSFVLRTCYNLLLIPLRSGSDRIIRILQRM